MRASHTHTHTRAYAHTHSRIPHLKPPNLALPGWCVFGVLFNIWKLTEFLCLLERPSWVGVDGTLCLIIYSLRLSQLLTLVASRILRLLQGKSDTLRTGEGVPGARRSRSGRSFESSRVGVGAGVTFFKSGDLPPGCLFTGLGAERSEAGSWRELKSDISAEPAQRLEVCLAGTQDHTVGSGHWLDWTTAGLWWARLLHWLTSRSWLKAAAAVWGQRSRGPSASARPRAGPLHRHAEQCVGRASSPAVPTGQGLCGPWVRQPPRTEGGVSSSGLILCQPWER